MISQQKMMLLMTEGERMGIRSGLIVGAAGGALDRIKFG